MNFKCAFKISILKFDQTFYFDDYDMFKNLKDLFNYFLFFIWLNL